METSYSLVSCERESTHLVTSRVAERSWHGSGSPLLPVPDTGQRTLQSSGLWTYDLLLPVGYGKVGLEECMCVSACVCPSAINKRSMP